MVLHLWWLQPSPIPVITRSRPVIQFRILPTGWATQTNVRVWNVFSTALNLFCVSLFLVVVANHVLHTKVVLSLSLQSGSARPLSLSSRCNILFALLRGDYYIIMSRVFAMHLEQVFNKLPYMCSLGQHRPSFLSTCKYSCAIRADH